MTRSLFKKLILLLAPIAALFLASPFSGGLAQKKHDDSHTVMTWEHSDNHLKRRLEVRGKVEFTEDYADVKDVSEGGVVRIEEVTRAFFMNGQARELDAAARTWIAEMVLNAVRHGGIDAEKRVQTILSRRGVAGVLQEIEQINTDHARRRDLIRLRKGLTAA